MHRCTKCGEEKNSASFYRDARKASGLQSHCKECMKAHQRADRPARREWERAHANKPGVREKQAAQARQRRTENPEAARAYQRKLYEQNRERFKERNRLNSIKRRFNLTEAEYGVMLASQGGNCAICGQNRSIKPTFRLSIDHDHATGDVRGLLCSNCNIGLGHFADSPRLLRAAADYIERTAAKRSA